MKGKLFPETVSLHVRNKKHWCGVWLRPPLEHRSAIQADGVAFFLSAVTYYINSFVLEKKMIQEKLHNYSIPGMDSQLSGMRHLSFCSLPFVCFLSFFVADLL